MRFEIDQSGKIEDTAKLTIVAFANGKAKSLKISAVQKRKVVLTLREFSLGKTFIFRIFAGLIFLLIKDEKAPEIVIDREYPGHEATIKELLLQLFRKNSLPAPVVHFACIGKQSEAHRIAVETFRGKRKPDLIVEAREVLCLFFGDKKRSWRSHTG